MWKTGKRKAEKDDFTGGRFFFMVFSPESPLDWEAENVRAEDNSHFAAEFDKSNKQLVAVLSENAKRQENSELESDCDFLIESSFCIWHSL